MEFPAGNTQALALRNWAGRFQAAMCCKLTGGILTSSVEDIMTHLGRFFTVPDIDTDVDIATPKDYLFITPDDDDLEVHAAFGAYLGAGGYVSLYEEPTVTDNGDALTPQNHKRSSTYEAAVSAFKDPTITNVGTLIDISGVGSAGGNVKVGGVAGVGHWDIKKNTTYLLRINVLTDNTLVTHQSDWFEFDRTLLEFPEDEGSSSSA